MRRRTLDEIRAEMRDRVSPCPDPRCGCLLWTGPLDKEGYGRISAGPAYSAVSRSYKSTWRAVHRVAWELENGPIPDGLTIDHVRSRGCQHKHCMNLMHLEPVTVRTNVLRGGGPAAVNAAKTHCLHGHPFDQANTYVRPNGWRFCRVCNAIRSREWRARRSSSGAPAEVAS